MKILTNMIKTLRIKLILKKFYLKLKNNNYKIKNKKMSKIYFLCVLNKEILIVE